jgi:hypothetical protein
MKVSRILFELWDTETVMRSKVSHVPYLFRGQKPIGEIFATEQLPDYRKKYPYRSLKTRKRCGMRDTA